MEVIENQVEMKAIYVTTYLSYYQLKYICCKNRYLDRIHRATANNVSYCFFGGIQTSKVLTIITREIKCSFMGFDVKAIMLSLWSTDIMEMC